MFLQNTICSPLELWPMSHLCFVFVFSDSVLPVAKTYSELIPKLHLLHMHAGCILQFILNK